MRQFTVLGRLLLTLTAAIACGSAHAQSTDGYHAIQVFPVVVDTASFTQRFTLRNPNPVAITLQVRYFPANGTTGVPLTCPELVVPAQSSSVVNSLRTMCPALAAGSQFGFLHVILKTFDITTSHMVFSGFSRVANPQGNGFSVEAFPAHTFTSATSFVTGIRRLAATGGAPAFQTNCFIGNLNEVVPHLPFSAPVNYTLLTATGTQIATASVNLAPGQIIRLLDVFAIAPVGDYNDASVRFETVGADNPGILAFCTVQDNSSFGADFRIAKQEQGDPVTGGGLGAQDDHVRRDWRLSQDALGTNFVIADGNFYNVHVVYFRHPDFVACELTDATGLRLPPEANLELVLISPDNFPVFAGNSAYFGVYLGDKNRRNNGANGRYRLIVEQADNIGSNAMFYTLHCMSGSGHTMGDMIRQNGQPDVN